MMLRAMKIHKVAVWGCLLLASEAGAQVWNDLCANAWIPVNGTNGPCSCGGFNQNGYFGEGLSLVGAVANFPYPTNLGSCAGYAANVSAPAADVWFLFPYWEGTMERQCITCSDTCHVSYWVGSCGVLAPANCFTILPNVPTQISPGLCCDTLFLQISGTQLSSSASFDLCTHFIPGFVNYTPLNWSLPTPVTCFAANTNVILASGAAVADGSISITMIDGNGPWQILWDDGTDSFTRGSLLPGNYSYSITDVIGCSQLDTVLVGYSDPTGFEGPETGGGPGQFKAHCSGDYLQVQGIEATSWYQIRNSFGQLAGEGWLGAGSTTLAIDFLTPGIYTFAVTIDGEVAKVSRFLFQR
jgi:hypothetical protein